QGNQGTSLHNSAVDASEVDQWRRETEVEEEINDPEVPSSDKIEYSRARELLDDRARAPVYYYWHNRGAMRSIAVSSAQGGAPCPAIWVTRQRPRVWPNTFLDNTRAGRCANSTGGLPVC